jgi:hypothetical protein
MLKFILLTAPIYLYFNIIAMLNFIYYNQISDSFVAYHPLHSVNLSISMDSNIAVRQMLVLTEFLKIQAER